MNKKKKIVKILLTIVVLIMIIGTIFIIKVSNKVKDMVEETVQVDIITQQYLVKSIGATGTVVSKDMRTVTGELMNAEIDEVFVEEGDFVNKGEAIAIFKSDDLEDDLKDAAEALKDAKKRIELTKESQDRALEDAERNKEYQLSTAQDNLKSTEDAIDDLKESKKEAEDKLEELKDSEDNANNEYKLAKKNLEDSDKKLESCKTNLEKAEKIVEDAKKEEQAAKEEYNKFKNELDSKKEADKKQENTDKKNEDTEGDENASPTISGNNTNEDINKYEEDENKLAELKKTYDSKVSIREQAEKEYETAKSKHDDEFKNNTSLKLEVQAKETSYNTAKLTRQSQENTIDTLEQNIKDAEDGYKSGVKNYDNLVATQNSAIESVKNNKELSSLTSNTDLEQKQVDALEEQLEKIMVKSPISGIVTSIKYDSGDKYNSGPIAIIQDCSEYEIEAYVGEYDISDIEEGQKVIIKTDATRDDELEGTVDFVSPTGTKVGTDTSYKIRIKLNDVNDRLRLDMSASLSIIIQEKENAITVPYNAIQEDENGKTFIEIKNSDETFKKVYVDVLMESNYYTEIKQTDDIKVGDTIKIIEEEASMNPLEMLGVF